MGWIDRYLSEEDRRAISAAIAAVETKTSGEVIPVIVRRSCQVGHVPWILTSIFALLILGSELRYVDDLLATKWLVLTPALILTAHILSLALARLSAVQRWLTVNSDETAAVLQRAELEFYRARAHKTSRRTGVLIFVSIMEREAVILADQGAYKSVSPEVWRHKVDLLRPYLRRGQWREGFIKVIEDVGGLLEQIAPPLPGERNEHPDVLIVRD